ncbi:hypothetical protein NC651_010812 [Populus alba x Populus x berolinensis]|nr:hypothetical protein NC651_010812 [Populus alba x Populus x berolinensis]
MFQLKSDSQPTSKKGKCIDWFVLLPTVFSVGGSDYCYRHSAVLQALGMDEDDMREINDETLLDEEAMAR